jgi:outer membrane protein
MKRSSFSVSALKRALCVSMLCVTPFAFANAELRIAVVSFDAVIQESPQLKTMQQALQAEFGPKERELTQLQKDLKAKADKFQKDQATMTDAEKTKLDRDLRDGQRELERRANEYKEDRDVRQNEEIQKLQRAVAEDIRAYAKFQGYDLVLYQGVLYNKDTLDITLPLIQAIKDKQPKPAAAADKPAADKPAAKK